MKEPRTTSVTLKPKAVALLFFMRDTNENVLFVGEPRVKCSEQNLHSSSLAWNLWGVKTWGYHLALFAGL